MSVHTRACYAKRVNDAEAKVYEIDRTYHGKQTCCRRSTCAEQRGTKHIQEREKERVNLTFDGFDTVRQHAHTLTLFLLVVVVSFLALLSCISDIPCKFSPQTGCK